MSSNEKPSSVTTCAPAPAKLFSWTSSPDQENSVVVRPWLTRYEQMEVQELFETKLSFARMDDKDGTGTRISPRIGETGRQLIETKLQVLWANAQVDPRRRPRTQPKRDESATTTTSKDIHTTGRDGSTRDSRSSTSPSSRRETPPEPKIVFAANAYLKYIFMCTARGGHTEVGGYGVHEITGKYRNIIYIKDFLTVRQDVSPAFCSLDADHANELVVALCMADENFNPNQLLACWCHTHPGFSVTPSGTDWNTFADHNAADWAGMIILGKDGQLGAHIRQRGPLYDAIKSIKATVDWESMATPQVAAMITPEAWEEEYMQNIWPSARYYHPEFRQVVRAAFGNGGGHPGLHQYEDPRGPRMIEMPAADPTDFPLAQQQLLLDEINSWLQEQDAESPLITFGEHNEPAPVLQGTPHGNDRDRTTANGTGEPAAAQYPAG
jgi:proteasome lid subunit RPN8/RPN11